MNLCGAVLACKERNLFEKFRHLAVCISAFDVGRWAMPMGVVPTGGAVFGSIKALPGSIINNPSGLQIPEALIGSARFTVLLLILRFLTCL